MNHFYDCTETTIAVTNNEVSCTEDWVLLLSQLHRNACRCFYDRRGRDDEAWIEKGIATHRVNRANGIDQVARSSRCRCPPLTNLNW
jgi:hypothetical protein